MNYPQKPNRPPSESDMGSMAGYDPNLGISPQQMQNLQTNPPPQANPMGFGNQPQSPQSLSPQYGLSAVSGLPGQNASSTNPMANQINAMRMNLR